MKFEITKGRIESFKADLIAIGCHEQKKEDGKRLKAATLKTADGGTLLDKIFGGAISRQLATENFSGKKGETRLLFTAGKVHAKFILLTGLGPKGSVSLDVLRETGACMTKEASKAGAASIALVLERGANGGKTPQVRARTIAEGILQGAYSFDRYKDSDNVEKRSHKETFIVYDGNPSPVRSDIDTGRIVAKAVLKARDLVNTPSADATPSFFAKYAKELAHENKLPCKVLSRDEIKKERMECLLAVSQGSAELPAFIELEYRPKKKPKAHVALVGKGITFDAGGISIKPSRGMDGMKSDMAGAAAVLEAMFAIAKLKSDIRVSAYMPMAENMPDGKAIKPGDVVRARNGKTIEIVNTDAEGRLVLADALAYASEKKPDVIIDVATLTGGAAYCCGELYTIAVGNDEKKVAKLIAASKRSGEPVWQLPLVQDYKKGYTSGIADLNNTGKGKAQTILGALFLEEFVDDVPWIHLDIGATAWKDEDTALCPKGGTGAMVRTIIEFVMNY